VNIRCDSGMTADHYPHDFQIQNEETDNLPGKELPPETGAFGGYRRVSLILVSAYYVFSVHLSLFKY